MRNPHGVDVIFKGCGQAWIATPYARVRPQRRACTFTRKKGQAALNLLSATQL